MSVEKDFLASSTGNAADLSCSYRALFEERCDSRVAAEDLCIYMPHHVRLNTDPMISTAIPSLDGYCSYLLIVGSGGSVGVSSTAVLDAFSGPLCLFWFLLGLVSTFGSVFGCWLWITSVWLFLVSGLCCWVSFFGFMGLPPLVLFGYPAVFFGFFGFLGSLLGFAMVFLPLFLGFSFVLLCPSLVSGFVFYVVA
ncbi:hypothetical protein U1Q18_033659 [Sarracenia purpurea var. burkii]